MAKYILTMLNTFSMIMHLLFGISLCHEDFLYVDILSVENTLITFIFAVLAYLSWIGKFRIINLLFWCIFEVCIFLFHPSITTLCALRNDSIQAVQLQILIISGLCGIICSLYLKLKSN